MFNFFPNKTVLNTLNSSTSLTVKAKALTMAHEARHEPAPSSRTSPPPCWALARSGHTGPCADTRAAACPRALAPAVSSACSALPSATPAQPTPSPPENPPEQGFLRGSSRIVYLNANQHDSFPCHQNVSILKAAIFILLTEGPHLPRTMPITQ